MRYLPSLVSSSLIALTRALPQGIPGPIDPSQVINQPLPTDSSGSLRGPDSLLGYSPSNPISQESTVIPPDEFELGPGQSEDAELGLYIDLENVANPQPIRGGTTGPTEPGPRYVSPLDVPQTFH
jgi:hypothetical protein